MSASTPLLNPIAVAIEPRRQASIDRAMSAAIQTVDRVQDLLAQVGFNLNVAAPRPLSTMSRRDYLAAKNKRSFFEMLTHVVSTTGTWRTGTVIVAMNSEGIARYYENVTSCAGSEFDAYVAKLSAKIGAVTAAAIDAAPLWDGSRLEVTTAAGERQVWKTKMILNVSSLGKLFNQWPTRRIA